MLRDRGNVPRLRPRAATRGPHSPYRARGRDRRRTFRPSPARYLQGAYAPGGRASGRRARGTARSGRQRSRVRAARRERRAGRTTRSRRRAGSRTTRQAQATTAPRSSRDGAIANARRRGAAHAWAAILLAPDAPEDGAPVAGCRPRFQRRSAQVCEVLRDSTPSTRTRDKRHRTRVADCREIVIRRGRSALDDLDVAGDTSRRRKSHLGDPIEPNLEVGVPTFPYHQASDPPFDDHTAVPHDESPVPPSKHTGHADSRAYEVSA